MNNDEFQIRTVIAFITIYCTFLAGCDSDSTPAKIAKKIAATDFDLMPTETTKIPVVEDDANETARDEVKNLAKERKETPAITIDHPALEDLFLFYPDKFPKGNWNPDPAPEDVWIFNEDGTRVHGWFFASANPRAVILYSHGNAGNIAFLAERMEQLRTRFQVSILAYDYRGYGKSAGVPTVSGIVKDSQAAFDFLSKHSHSEKSQIVLMGTSLGGAISIQLASENRVRALIVESSFSSLKDMAYIVAPDLAFLVPAKRLNSVEAITKFQGPYFQSHGDADRAIPMELGRRVFNAANEPKFWFTDSGLDHNDPVSSDNLKALDSFLRQIER